MKVKRRITADQLAAYMEKKHYTPQDIGLAYIMLYKEKHGHCPAKGQGYCTDSMKFAVSQKLRHE